MKPNGTACVMKLSVFLGVAVLLAALTVPMGALGQQTAQDFLKDGNVKMDKGDRVGAMADFSKAIEIDPKITVAYILRGIARQSNGELADAIADFSKAIELDPNEAVAYVNRGTAKRFKGDQAGAEADFALAAKLLPSRPNAADAKTNQLFGLPEGELVVTVNGKEVTGEEKTARLAEAQIKDIQNKLSTLEQSNAAPGRVTEPAHISAREFESQYQLGHQQTMKDAEYLGHHRELSEAETRELLSTLGGVGVQIAPVAEGVVVQKVLPDTSACAAGVKSGDVITEVDSKPVRKLKLLDVVHRLRGPVGSEVALTLSRKGQVEPVKMKLVRKVIPYYKDHPNCEGSPLQIGRTNSRPVESSEITSVRRRKYEGTNSIMDFCGGLSGLRRLRFRGHSQVSGDL